MGQIKILLELGLKLSLQQAIRKIMAEKRFCGAQKVTYVSVKLYYRKQSHFFH